jgi:hypothetical protein
MIPFFHTDAQYLEVYAGTFEIPSNPKVHTMSVIFPEDGELTNADFAGLCAGDLRFPAYVDAEGCSAD